MDIHHITADGTSLKIFINEFVNLYLGKSIPEVNIQYKDYTVWKSQETQDTTKEEAYWQQQFADGIPVLNLPTDYPRPKIKSFRGKKLVFEIDDKLHLGIRNLCRIFSTTTYMVLLCAMNILLHKYSGQDDIVIGCPIDERKNVELENTMGVFINMLPIRNRLDENKTIQEFLQEVQHNAIKAYENSNYPFGELIESKKANRDKSRNPLYDVILIEQRKEHVNYDEIHMNISPETMDNGAAMADLTLNIFETQHLNIMVEYCIDLFTEDSIQKIIQEYCRIIDYMILNSQMLIRDIKINNQLNLVDLSIAEVDFNF